MAGMLLEEAVSLWSSEDCKGTPSCEGGEPLYGRGDLDVWDDALPSLSHTCPRALRLPMTGSALFVGNLLVGEGENVLSSSD